MVWFYKIAAYSLFFGVIHVALTPMFYQQLSPDSLWFVGTGLALVFAAFLNISAEKVRQHWILNLAIFCNIALLVFGVLTVLVLPEFQAILALLFYCAVTVGSLHAKIGSVRPSQLCS